VIENGSQGTIRHDLIGVMYKNSGGVESAQISVIKGTAGETGTDPTYPKGNIEGGSTSYFVPIYRVVLNGLNIESVQKIIETRYRIPNFLPVGTSEPDSNLGENGDVYFQIVIE
jgi:hypothetical protein